MMDEHAKVVAKRHKDKNEREFRRYLRYCYWTESEIDEMWAYAQRKKGEGKDENN